MKKYYVAALLLISGMLMAKQYTLQNLIEAGIDNSYSIRQKEIMLKNADLNLSSAKWNLLPSADINAVRTNTDEFYTNRASLTVARRITLNEPTYFNYRQATLDKSIAKLDWQQTRKELVYNIYSAWLDLAQLQKEIDIRNRNLVVLRKVKEQTELQQRLGQRTNYDVTQSDINLINAELSIVELTNQMQRQKAQLLNTVKLQDDGVEFVFNENSLSEFAPNFSIPTAETLELSKLQDDLKKSRLDKIQQKIAIFPSVYVSASYDQHSMNNDVLVFDKYDDSYTLAIGLSWSLWSPWTKGNNYAQVRNSLVLKQWQYEENQSALSLDRQNLKREWDYLQETLTLNRKKATQASDNLLIAQERYNLGSLSMIELEQARVNALEAELAVNKLTYQIQKKAQEWNLLNSHLILNKY